MTWYCIHTRPLKEGRVAAHLRDRLELETYSPRLKRERTIRRVKRQIVSPLFPRYLFCRFDWRTGFRAVNYAPDVISVVTIGAVPAVVDDAIIATLKSWAGDAVDLITIQPGLRAGDRVEIRDGPMRGMQAVMLPDRNDRDRVAVLLSILERQVPVLISRSQLSPVV